MPFGECKIYFDGSHYIGIPHTIRELRRREKMPDKEIYVTDIGNEQSAEMIKTVKVEENASLYSNDSSFMCKEIAEQADKKPENQPNSRIMTRKELFEELYKSTSCYSRKERRKYIIDKIKRYFDDEESAVIFVDKQFDRKLRNMICRRIRLTRKVNLQEFNYFCTFTYDGEKHTEESFKKKLQGCFKMMCHRKGWKYVGVWERSPTNNRLHFQGIFYIPFHDRHSYRTERLQH